MSAGDSNANLWQTFLVRMCCYSKPSIFNLLSSDLLFIVRIYGQRLRSRCSHEFMTGEVLLHDMKGRAYRRVVGQYGEETVDLSPSSCLLIFVELDLQVMKQEQYF